MSKWVNCELDPTVSGRFRGYLKDMGIKFEVSQAWNLVHFECFMTEQEMEAANEFIDTL